MYADAVAALNAAIKSISAEEYRAARLMLDIAATQNGHLYLTREEACDLFCVASWASVRRMLGHLADAGIIEHHTNNRAYVLFVQYAAPRTTCAPEITTGADRAPDARPEDQPSRTTGSPARTTGANRAPRDHQRAPGARPRVGRIGGINSPTPEGDTYLPTQPGPDEPPTADLAPPEEQPLPEEQRRNYELLTDPDVGIDKRSARKFAATWHWPTLLAVVCKWRRDLDDGQVDGNGALHYRLGRNYGATLTDRDRASPLYQRHVPEEERLAEEMAQRMSEEEERRHKYIPPEYADIIIG